MFSEVHCTAIDLWITFANLRASFIVFMFMLLKVQVLWLEIFCRCGLCSIYNSSMFLNIKTTLETTLEGNITSKGYLYNIVLLHICVSWSVATPFFPLSMSIAKSTIYQNDSNLSRSPKVVFTGPFLLAYVRVILVLCDNPQFKLEMSQFSLLDSSAR